MSETVRGTQSFSRSIQLLQHIADRATPPSLQDLLSECDYTRPTLYRLLASLESEELIIKTPERRYKLGVRLVALARGALADMDIRQLARPALENLRDQTGETVHLATRSKDELVYIDKIESLEVVRMASTIGTRVPFHSTSVGRAYLAELPNEEQKDLAETLVLMPITPFTAKTLGMLYEQIAICQTQGYYFEHQENELGIACFGAAIRGDNGRPIAAVSVSVPLFRLRDDRNSYANPLLECVAAVSSLMGNT